MAQKEKILKKAQKYAQKGAFEKAVAEYRSLIDMDADDVSLRLRLGDLFVKIGNNEEAVKEYTSAAKYNARRGFYLKAIAVYKRVLTIDKGSTEIHYKLAELYTKQRLIADAMSQYTIILNTFEQKGMDNEELDILKKMVELDPSNLSIRLKLADMFRKADFLDDAFETYRFVCGKLFEAGNIKKAEDIFLELYENYPEDLRVLTGLVNIYREKHEDEAFITYASKLTQNYVAAGELEDAADVCREILSIKDDDEGSLNFLESYESPALAEELPIEDASEVEEASVIEADVSHIGDDGGELDEDASEEELSDEAEENIEVTLSGFEDDDKSDSNVDESEESGLVEGIVNPLYDESISHDDDGEEYVSLDIPGLTEGDNEASEDSSAEDAGEVAPDSEYPAVEEVVQSLLAQDSGDVVSTDVEVSEEPAAEEEPAGKDAATELETSESVDLDDEDVLDGITIDIEGFEAAEDLEESEDIEGDASPLEDDDTSDTESDDIEHEASEGPVYEFDPFLEPESTEAEDTPLDEDLTEEAEDYEASNEAPEADADLEGSEVVEVSDDEKREGVRDFSPLEVGDRIPEILDPMDEEGFEELDSAGDSIDEEESPLLEEELSEDSGRDERVSELEVSDEVEIVDESDSVDDSLDEEEIFDAAAESIEDGLEEAEVFEVELEEAAADLETTDDSLEAVDTQLEIESEETEESLTGDEVEFVEIEEDISETDELLEEEALDDIDTEDADEEAAVSHFMETVDDIEAREIEGLSALDIIDDVNAAHEVFEDLEDDEALLEEEALDDIDTEAADEEAAVSHFMETVDDIEAREIEGLSALDVIDDVNAAHEIFEDLEDDEALLEEESLDDIESDDEELPEVIDDEDVSVFLETVEDIEAKKEEGLSDLDLINDVDLDEEIFDEEETSIAEEASHGEPVEEADSTETFEDEEEEVFDFVAQSLEETTEGGEVFGADETAIDEDISEEAAEPEVEDFDTLEEDERLVEEELSDEGESAGVDAALEADSHSEIETPLEEDDLETHIVDEESTEVERFEEESEDISDSFTGDEAESREGESDNDEGIPIAFELSALSQEIDEGQTLEEDSASDDIVSADASSLSLEEESAVESLEPEASLIEQDISSEPNSPEATLDEDKETYEGEVYPDSDEAEAVEDLSAEAADVVGDEVSDEAEALREDGALIETESRDEVEDAEIDDGGEVARPLEVEEADVDEYEEEEFTVAAKSPADSEGAELSADDNSGEAESAGGVEVPLDDEILAELETTRDSAYTEAVEDVEDGDALESEDLSSDEAAAKEITNPESFYSDLHGFDSEEPIEIYTEPELEEAIQNLARSSVAGDVFETYEELKTGFEKQLSTEDAGTHFNLGKEYLDMELFKEASREFKIALKDKSLGLDCYINLAACSMAEANHDEAVIYYLKILKTFNGSEVLRRGFLYDLALAYAGSGQEREAEGIFTSIYETDPRFRDVAKKIKMYRSESNVIPVDDSLLEVELL